MADQDNEIRRMAEIADAINAILDADSSEVDDGERAPRPADAATPTETPAETSGATPSATMTDAAPDMAPDAAASAGDDIDTMIAQQADAMTQPAAESADDLDAAIAAEFSGGDAPASAADDPFGAPPMPTTGASEPAPSFNRDVRDDSGLANLSVRMQDTLSELRAQASYSNVDGINLLAEMEQAHQEIVVAMRGEINKLVDTAAARRQQILTELEQLDAQTQMTRDELEMMVVRFEATLKDLHTRYLGTSQLDQDRLDRYREFLQYLLSQRG